MRGGACLRGFAIVAGVAVAAVILAAQLGTPRVIDGYELLDEDTILIHTSDGRLTWTRVTQLVETAESVDVTVKSFAAPVPATDQAFPAFFVVDLEAALGNRRVLDRSNEVPLFP